MLAIIKIYFCALTALLEVITIENLPNNTVTFRNSSHKLHLYTMLINLYEETKKFLNITDAYFLQAKQSFWSMNTNSADMDIFLPLTKTIFNGLENEQIDERQMLIYILMVEGLLELNIVNEIN